MPNATVSLRLANHIDHDLVPRIPDLTGTISRWDGPEEFSETVAATYPFPRDPHLAFTVPIPTAEEKAFIYKIACRNVRLAVKLRYWDVEDGGSIDARDCAWTIEGWQNR
jgi:hypothetical protein